MKKHHLLAVVALLLAATPVAAQPIHGHPQKQAYASPAEWPDFADGQFHWSLFDSVQTAHCGHIIPKFPYYAELNDDPFDFAFTIKMYHCAGKITGLVIADAVLAPSQVVWDMGASLPLKGDPNAVLTFTGKIHFDPKTLGRWHHQHGWMAMRLATTVTFDTGDSGQNNLHVPYFSVADPTAPEDPPFGGHGPVISVRNTTAPLSQTNFGDMVMQIDDYLPLLPITGPWAFLIEAYNYTAVVPCCQGLFEQRRDLDLHAGNQGTLILSQAADIAGVTRTILLDPTGLSKGPHKDALFWKSTFGPETTTALLSIGWTVGDGVPSGPVLCADPKATNVGGPLPCVFPPPVDPLPPPPPIFQPVFRLDPVKGILICQTADPATCMPIVK